MMSFRRNLRAVAAPAAAGRRIASVTVQVEEAACPPAQPPAAADEYGFVFADEWAGDLFLAVALRYGFEALPQQPDGPTIRLRGRRHLVNDTVWPKYHEIRSLLRTEEPPRHLLPDETALVEYAFILAEPWAREIFLILARRYGMEIIEEAPADTTVRLRAREPLVYETLWPRYRQIISILRPKERWPSAARPDPASDTLPMA
jgi:hypothetical protein